MASIQVLGTGCHNCIELERRLAEVLLKLGRQDVKVQRVDDERTILRHMPLDAVPGLLIDGRLVSERTVPSLEMLTLWLESIPVLQKP